MLATGMNIQSLHPCPSYQIQFDYDGVKNRQNDIMLSDKTVYDEKIADIVSDYIKLAKDLLALAKIIAYHKIA
jgi:NTE family protein